jgi:hypothetical protein
MYQCENGISIKTINQVYFGEKASREKASRKQILEIFGIYKGNEFILVWHQEGIIHAVQPFNGKLQGRPTPCSRKRRTDGQHKLRLYRGVCEGGELRVGF